ncbi:MAG: methionyl-tRNA formyltransferase [Myxococcaceae bacterium]
MGTPEFAVASLRACFDVGDVVAVVTQPDKPKGRGQEVQMPPVKELALSRNVPVLQPPKIRGTNFHEELAALKPDVFVVTAYGKILPKDVLAVPPKGCVNAHASILPRYRGAAPLQWAIANGDSETGVCLMLMDEGMDTGPVISCRKLPIETAETLQTLHDKLSSLGGAMIREDLPRYLSGDLKPSPQPKDGVVMAPMIEKDEGRLIWTRKAAELERRLRAFTPWPGAFTTFEGALLKVHAAEVGAGRGEPGEILRADSTGIEVATSEGSLVLKVIQPEGKRRMTAAEFLAGRKIEKGSRPFEERGAKP